MEEGKVIGYAILKIHDSVFIDTHKYDHLQANVSGLNIMMYNSSDRLHNISEMIEFLCVQPCVNVHESSFSQKPQEQT